ncbi:DUF2147 domain-containing protein [Xanthobacter sediminis]|uniref:DUF2147 domain-containing protein n=1 Tax=Xanthobacter sediminis TaxID=3119926 RepID=UPI0037276CB2
MQERTVEKLTRRALAAALALGLLCGPARAGGDITGIWMTEDQDGAVLIEPCADALCGRIVWLKSPLDEEGRPVRDENNSDSSLRARSLCGIAVLGGARPSGEGWEGGWIYDPNSGTKYALSIRQGENDTLAVTGFIGVKAMGQTLEWHRAPAALKRCDGAATPSGKPAAGSRS